MKSFPPWGLEKEISNSPVLIPWLTPEKQDKILDSPSILISFSNT